MVGMFCLEVQLETYPWTRNNRNDGNEMGSSVVNMTANIDYLKLA
jgi:hypothetical protein